MYGSRYSHFRGRRPWGHHDKARHGRAPWGSRRAAARLAWPCGQGHLRAQERVQRPVLRRRAAAAVPAGGGSPPVRPRRVRGPGHSVLLRNGGRLYLDVAGRPEYATPGCSSVPDLVVRDKAGERILEGLVADAGQRLRDEGIAGDIQVLKRADGPAGSSSGCQEDYLVGPGRQFRQAGRHPDPVPGHQAAHLRCGRGSADTTRRRVLPRPAGRAHRDRLVVRGRPVPAAHQYPRRTARRRAAAVAGDRQRPRHERDHHAAQGGRHRPRAAHGRGGHRGAGPDPGQPSPRHRRGQPGHNRADPGPAGRRPADERARHPARVPGQGEGLRQQPRRGSGQRARPADCGSGRWTR